MRPLALPKLPDRNPVKRTIVCEPELNRVLEEYALLYREIYGETESVETLIPFMLSAFLVKDRAFRDFRNARATHADAGRSDDPGDGRRRRRGKLSLQMDGDSSRS
jgi:hypothetical protein